MKTTEQGTKTAYKVKLNSLYICVNDMQRAIKFYEEFLQLKSNNPESGLFIVNGIRLCMYDYRKFNDTVSFANSCLPRFEAADMDHVFNKLKELNTQIIMSPTSINGYKVLRFEDSEGNKIEVYSKQ